MQNNTEDYSDHNGRIYFEVGLLILTVMSKV